MSWSQPLIFVRDGKNGDVLLPARTSIEAAMVSTMQIDDVRNGNGVCIRMGRARIPVTKGTKPEMDAGFYGPLVAACRIPMVEDIRR